MKIQRTLISSTLGLASVALATMLVMQSHPAGAAHAKKAKKHLLVVTVTTGFPHDSRPTSEKVITEIGERTGEWDTDVASADNNLSVEEKGKILAAKMSPEALKKYDAVVFSNTTGVLPLPDPQGFLDYIKAGHGFAGMHSASDTFHEWPGSKVQPSEYIDMLGGEFLTHHGQTSVDAHVEDAMHPATRELLQAASKTTPAASGDIAPKGKSFLVGKTWKIYDEIYLLKNNDRTKVHVLLSMDKYPNDGSPDANKPGDHLLSWSKSYGAGRVFYTELGHNIETWQDPLYQAHVQGGIEFALGISKGSTKLSAPLTASAK